MLARYGDWEAAGGGVALCGRARQRGSRHTTSRSRSDRRRRARPSCQGVLVRSRVLGGRLNADTQTDSHMLAD
jgi:hypothetical protein